MFRVEVFDRSLENVGAAATWEQPTSVDYLTMEGFTLDVPSSIGAQKGFYARVVDGDGESKDFVVSDVQVEHDMNRVTLRPLQAIFDFDVWTTEVTDVSLWIAQQITEQLVSNDDEMQDIPIAVTAQASGETIQLDGTTTNLLDAICSALEAFGIVVKCHLDFGQGLIITEIGTIPGEIYIDADQKNIIDRSIVLGDSYGGANKTIIQQYTVDKESKEETVVGTTSFYLHPDGTVDDVDENRIVPVFWTLERLKDEQKEEEPWYEKALALARERLAPAAFDNEITLVYAKADRLIEPAAMRIGQKANIKVDGVWYPSILTSVSDGSGTITLTFGAIRVSLTKKLSVGG